MKSTADTSITYGPHRIEVTAPPPRPRDNKGHFISMECQNPNCGNGTLVYNGFGIWECDGLESPERDDQELRECSYWWLDGSTPSHV